MADATTELNLLLTAKDQASKELDGLKKNVSGLGKALGDVGKIASGVLTADLVKGGFQKLTGFIGDSITAASDLGESMNAVNKIFGESQKQILDWGKNNATSFGLSQREFNQLVVPLGAGLKNAGLDMDTVSSKSIQLTERAADMASVFNTDVGEALAAIQAGLRGEADPLEKFGVGLSAAKVEAHALAMTGKEVAASLTEQEKMLARVDLLMIQTSDTQGDFAATSGEVANAARIQQAKMEELQATIGTKLLPVQLATTKAKMAMVAAIADHVIPALDNFIKYIQFAYTEGDQLNDFLANLPPSLQGVALGFGELAVYLSQGEEGFKNNNNAVSDLGQQLIALAKIVQDTSAAIQENWSSIETVTSYTFVAIGGVLDSFIAKTQQAQQVVGDMVGFVNAIFHAEWADAWNSMKGIAGAAVDGVINQIDSQFAGLPGMLYSRGTAAGSAFVQGLKDAAGSLAESALNIGTFGAYGKLKDIDFRAAGGPVSAGQGYIVGERGPELFVPQQSGNIVPNGAGGQQGDVHIHVAGDFITRDEAEAKTRGRDIGFALRRSGYAA